VGLAQSFLSGEASSSSQRDRPQQLSAMQTPQLGGLQGAGSVGVMAAGSVPQLLVPMFRQTERNVHDAR